MRTRYANPTQIKRLDMIRQKFTAPGKWVGLHAIHNDGSNCIPPTINTVLKIGDSPLGVADCRWRSRQYDVMEISARDGYWPLVEHVKATGDPTFLVWAFGDRLDLAVWIVDQHADVGLTVGGREDRSDSYDTETMVKVPFRWLKSPEEVWKLAGLTQDALGRMV